MVNGNYVLYGDRPSSESEIVEDHVHTRTAERKNKRKPTRTANELQRTLNMAQLDNETDSIKYEKKAKEPRLLRYVPTTDVEENFVTEKFETYDLKPTEERPRRYAFQKKPKNPADGSVNYAYSRSSSSCSSPNGNLPTISEHGEQYGTYRAQPLPSPRDADIMHQYEHKLGKYFYKPKEVKKFASKVNYEGSHPDSLYRVQPSTNSGVDKMIRVLRVLRWPVALVAVCIALAVFVYFLMPDNIQPEDAVTNRTFWIQSDTAEIKQPAYQHTPPTTKKLSSKIHIHGAKTPEIDFYDSESDTNSEFTSVIDTITETSPHRVLPIRPVFPSHITPEVQYGNERADADKLRTPKALDASSTISDDSTLKPHITHKPEKPLAVYFKEATTETISRAETVNEFANYGNKQTTKKVEVSTKTDQTAFKDHRVPTLKLKPLNIKQYLVKEPEIPPEVLEFYGPLESAKIDANFTSGHSKLFGISIEDAEKMKSTTQSSLYNTRVSPTLPTWRDGYDATTKDYPENVNYDAPLCRSTRFQLCREILPYDLAGFPVQIAGVDISAFVPHIEYLVGTNCSDRVKHFTCALLEPECNPRPYPAKLPCYNLCKSIVDACDGVIPRQLEEAFNCKRYPETDCVGARTPCFGRELDCGDGHCIPREWMCDNVKNCPNGEDEVSCSSCAANEFRCNSGGCILNQWLCDGYTDCPGGEDESEACDQHQPGEPGEEPAGSAPAPAIRRPNKIPAHRTGHHNVAFGEVDNSKELLVTSDSSNALKRNFTRRPSLSRLSPYTRSTTPPPTQMPAIRNFTGKRQETTTIRDFKKDAETTQKPEESMEDINIGDLGIFDDINKTAKVEKEQPKITPKPPVKSKPAPARTSPYYGSSTKTPTRLDKSINKLEKVINGAALIQKAQAAEDQEVTVDSPEAHTMREKPEDFPIARRPTGSKSAHASPCPSGELRCVDGRCITLAQLCDGTIDCTDHADEDNCYT